MENYKKLMKHFQVTENKELQIPTLSQLEKDVYKIISSLANGIGYCVANNKFLGHAMQKNQGLISQTIVDLEKKGLIFIGLTPSIPVHRKIFFEEKAFLQALKKKEIWTGQKDTERRN
jgi:hypothetical protein